MPFSSFFVLKFLGLGEYYMTSAIFWCHILPKLLDGISHFFFSLINLNGYYHVTEVRNHFDLIFQ